MTANYDRELQQKRFYKSLPAYYKHMSLMYFYRLKTDPENILDYLETHRFHSFNISPDFFPDFVARLTNEELYAEAYEAIGQRRPE